MKRALPLACALALGCATPQPQPGLANLAEAERLVQTAGNRTGNLRIDCSPDDATVAIDGLPMGLCSDFKGQRGVALKKGTRRLAVNKPGYLPYESIVDTDGTRVSLTISLAPASL